MEYLTALSTGALIGLGVAAPVGPMAVLCISRTLGTGLAAGISTGAGASTVQAGYASVLLLGLQEVGPFLASARPALSIFLQL